MGDIIPLPRFVCCSVEHGGNHERGCCGWRQGWGMNSLKYDEHGGGNFSYMDTTRHHAAKLRSPSQKFEPHKEDRAAGVGR
jgi:hypothetical protein